MPGIKQKKFLLILSFILYVILFFLLLPLAKEKVPVLSLFPIIVASVYFGLKAGITAAAAAVLLNTFFFFVAGLPASVMITNLPGALSSFILAAGIGLITDLYKKSKVRLSELTFERELLKKEISERKKAEEKIMILERALNAAINGIVITDPKLPDNPVIYANPAFESLTGYKKEEVLGKNCRILQGPATSSETVDQIRQSVRNKEECKTVILNYKKDGTPFWSDLSISPVKDASGEIINFVGIKSDITERIAAQAALKRSEEKFRSIVEHLNDGIILADEEGMIVKVNRKMESIFGIPADSALTKYLWNLPGIFREDNRDELKKEIQGTLRTGIAAESKEYKIHVSDGSEKIIMVIPVAIKTDRGFMLCSIIRDLTKQKEDEEEIKKLTRAVETSPAGIMLIEAGGKIVYVNSSVLSIGNYNHENEVLGKNICGFVNESGKNKITKKILPCLYSDYKWQGEMEIYRKNGELHYADLSCALVNDEKEKPKYILAVYNDISERKKAEAALIESENKYRSVVENVKEVIFQTDSSGKLTYLNPAWKEITGFSVEESTGEPFLNYVHPDDRETNSKLFEPLIKREKEYCRHVIRYIKKDGGCRWIEVFARLIVGKDNEVLGTTGTLNDVTDRKKAEEDIKAALQKERELNELRSRFVSTISHEFRTPLTSILASSELMQRYYHKWSDEKKLDTLKRIERSIEYLNEMISDVLMLNRTESGTLEFRPGTVDLVELSKNILEEVRLISKPDHEFHFNYDDSLRKVFLDEKLIRNIIVNLLSNSVKYSPKGGKIKLQLIRGSAGVEIIAEDQGIGIPEEDQKKLFQPFFRGTNIENISGTGLGLTILERAVTLHKGKIAFSSEPGKGTKFRIIIPDNEL